MRAAQAQSKNRRTLKVVAEASADWPPYSPGALNAWLLLVTTKPPSWRDNLVLWPDAPLAVGNAHEGFFYPDPLGFWTEVRRWSVELFRLYQPGWSIPEALALTTLLHLGDQPDRLQRALELSNPRTILFLDEPSWERAGLQAVRRELHSITDPHRQGQVYEGFWGRAADGMVVGKSPQHPAMHNLYRSQDMLGFVRAAPRPDGV